MTIQQNDYTAITKTLWSFGCWYVSMILFYLNGLEKYRIY